MTFMQTLTDIFTSRVISSVLLFLMLLLCGEALIVCYKKSKAKLPEPLNKFTGLTKNYYKTILICIFIVGILVRFAFFWIYPLGLNQDEASVAYDTFADLEYGFDRNGDHNPVYSVAWGSGHSSLYITFSKPFIALLGLNVFSARITNVLFSCLALFAFYGILKRLLSKDSALLGTLIFAIIPWHILMARWALECNLLPNMFIIATYFLVRGFEEQKFYIPSLFIYALCLYAYGTAIITVPVFVFVMAIYLIKHKKITWKMLGICAVVFTVTAIPIMLFAAVNFFGAPEMDFGFMTVPKLISPRYNSTVTLLSEEFYASPVQNFTEFLRVIFFQNDSLPWNAVSGYGIIYLFSLPFMILGLCTFISDSWQKRKGFNPSFIFIAALISIIILACLSTLNINRANFAFMPITFLTIYGMLFVMRHLKKVTTLILAVYIVAFVCFSSCYFTTYQQEIGHSFSYGYGDAIKYAESKAEGKIYSSSYINAPYILTMFYLKTDPKIFIDTVDYLNPDSECRFVNSFDRYYTGIPNPLPKSDKNAYIFSNYEYSQRTDFSKSDYEIKVFGNFTVATHK